MNIKKQINKFNVTYSEGNSEDVEIILPIESIKNLRTELDRLEALFSTKEVAAGIFDTYEDLFTFVNDQSKTKYLIGQYLLVKGSDTPELWIAGVEENSEPYEFESDDLVKKKLAEEGSIKVGYYRLSSIEPLIKTTQVTVNGEYQKSWNADTKLDVAEYTYASTEKGGIIQINNSSGIRIDENHCLYLDTLNDNEILNQSQSNAPLKAYQLPVAVKSALIKHDNITLDLDQQTTACEWIGAAIKDDFDDLAKDFDDFKSGTYENAMDAIHNDIQLIESYISALQEQDNKLLTKEGNDVPFIITPDGNNRNGAEYGDKYVKITYPTMGSATQTMYFPEKYVPAEETEETFAMLSDIPEVLYTHSFLLEVEGNNCKIWGMLPITEEEKFTLETFFNFLMEKGIEIPVIGYADSDFIFSIQGYLEQDETKSFIIQGHANVTYQIYYDSITSFTDNII